MKARSVVGMVITLAWLIGIAVIMWSQKGKLAEMSLAEMGDFVVGTFSPLAFMWIIISYRHQGEELSLNTEALTLQAKELNHAGIQRIECDES